MKKKLFILLIILGGLVMAFSLNGNIQKNKEAERNRQYEVSLVKALKNSYRDIDEIKFSSPHYAKPPGDWSCTVQLSFSDGRVIKDRVSHSLSTKINRSIDISTDETDIISSYYGTTGHVVNVIYSTGEEEVQ